MIDSMMQCQRCRFWNAERGVSLIGGVTGKGQCVRYPPRVQILPGKTVGSLVLQAMFPTTAGDNGCGEWSGQTDNKAME